MKVISSARGSGKTTRLVAESCTTGSVILVSSQSEINVIKDVAKKMGLLNFLPEPISVTSNSISGLRGEFLIDNVDIMLPTLLNVEIKTITVSNDGSKSFDFDNSYINYRKLPVTIQGHIDWQVGKGISIGRSIYAVYKGAGNAIHGKKEAEWIVRHENEYIKGYLERMDMEK